MLFRFMVAETVDYRGLGGETKPRKYGCGFHAWAVGRAEKFE